MATGGGAVPVAAEDYELKRRWGYQGGGVQEPNWRNADRSHVTQQIEAGRRQKQNSRKAGAQREQQRRGSVEGAPGIAAEQRSRAPASTQNGNVRKAASKRSAPSSPDRNGAADTARVENQQGGALKRHRPMELPAAAAFLTMSADQAMMMEAGWRGRPLMGPAAQLTNGMPFSRGLENDFRWGLRWQPRREDIERMAVGVRHLPPGGEDQLQQGRKANKAGTSLPPRPARASKLKQGDESEDTLSEGGSPAVGAGVSGEPSGISSRKKAIAAARRGAAGSRARAPKLAQNSPPKGMLPPAAPVRPANARSVGAAGAEWAPRQAGVLGRVGFHAGVASPFMSMPHMYAASNYAAPASWDIDLGLWARREVDIAHWLSELHQRDRAAGFRLEGAELQLQTSLRNRAQVYSLTHKHVADLQLVDLSAQVNQREAELESMLCRHKAYADEAADAEASLHACGVSVQKYVRQLDDMEDKLRKCLKSMRSAYKLSHRKLREPHQVAQVKPAAGKPPIGKPSGGVAKRKQSAPVRVQLNEAMRPPPDRQPAPQSTQLLPPSVSDKVQSGGAAPPPAKDSAPAPGNSEGKDPESLSREPGASSNQSAELNKPLPSGPAAPFKQASPEFSTEPAAPAVRPEPKTFQSNASTAGGGAILSARQLAETLLRKSSVNDKPQAYGPRPQPPPPTAPSARVPKSMASTTFMPANTTDTHYRPKQKLNYNEPSAPATTSSGVNATPTPPVQQLTESKGKATGRPAVVETPPATADQSGLGLSNGQRLGLKSAHSSSSAQMKARAERSLSAAENSSKSADKVTGSATTPETGPPTMKPSTSGAAPANATAGKAFKGLAGAGPFSDRSGISASVGLPLSKVSSPSEAPGPPAGDLARTSSGKKMAREDRVAAGTSQQRARLATPSASPAPTAQAVIKPSAAASTAGSGVNEKTADGGASAATATAHPQITGSLIEARTPSFDAVKAAAAVVGVHATAGVAAEDAPTKPAVPAGGPGRGTSSPSSTGVISGEMKTVAGEGRSPATTALSPKQAGSMSVGISPTGGKRSPGVAALVAAALRRQPIAKPADGSGAQPSPVAVPAGPAAGGSISTDTAKASPSSAVGSVSGLPSAGQAISKVPPVPPPERPRSEQPLEPPCAKQTEVLKGAGRAEKLYGEQTQAVRTPAVGPPQPGDNKGVATSIGKPVGVNPQVILPSSLAKRSSVDAENHSGSSKAEQQAKPNPAPPTMAGRAATPAPIALTPQSDKSSFSCSSADVKQGTPVGANATLGSSSNISSSDKVESAYVGKAQNVPPSPAKKPAGLSLPPTAVPTDSSSKSAATAEPSVNAQSVMTPRQSGSDKLASSASPSGQLGVPTGHTTLSRSNSGPKAARHCPSAVTTHVPPSKASGQPVHIDTKRRESVPKATPNKPMVQPPVKRSGEHVSQQAGPTKPNVCGNSAVVQVRATAGDALVLGSSDLEKVLQQTPSAGGLNPASGRTAPNQAALDTTFSPVLKVSTSKPVSEPAESSKMVRKQAPVTLPSPVVPTESSCKSASLPEASGKTVPASTVKASSAVPLETSSKHVRRKPTVSGKEDSMQAADVNTSSADPKVINVVPEPAVSGKMVPMHAGNTILASSVRKLSSSNPMPEPMDSGRNVSTQAAVAVPSSAMPKLSSRKPVPEHAAYGKTASAQTPIIVPSSATPRDSASKPAASSGKTVPTQGSVSVPSSTMPKVSSSKPVPESVAYGKTVPAQTRVTVSSSVVPKVSSIRPVPEPAASGEKIPRTLAASTVPSSTTPTVSSRKPVLESAVKKPVEMASGHPGQSKPAVDTNAVKAAGGNVGAKQNSVVSPSNNAARSSKDIEKMSVSTGKPRHASGGAPGRPSSAVPPSHPLSKKINSSGLVAKPIVDAPRGVSTSREPVPGKPTVDGSSRDVAGGNDGHSQRSTVMPCTSAPSSNPKATDAAQGRPSAGVARPDLGKPATPQPLGIALSAEALPKAGPSKSEAGAKAIVSKLPARPMQQSGSGKLAVSDSPRATAAGSAGRHQSTPVSRSTELSSSSSKGPSEGATAGKPQAPQGKFPTQPISAASGAAVPRVKAVSEQPAVKKALVTDQRQPALTNPTANSSHRGVAVGSSDRQQAALVDRSAIRSSGKHKDAQPRPSAPRPHATSDRTPTRPVNASTLDKVTAKVSTDKPSAVPAVNKPPVSSSRQPGPAKPAGGVTFRTVDGVRGGGHKGSAAVGHSAVLSNSGKVSQGGASASAVDSASDKPPTQPLRQASVVPPGASAPKVSSSMPSTGHTIKMVAAPAARAREPGPVKSAEGSDTSRTPVAVGSAIGQQGSGAGRGVEMKSSNSGQAGRPSSSTPPTQSSGVTQKPLPKADASNSAAVLSAGKKPPAAPATAPRPSEPSKPALRSSPKKADGCQQGTASPSPSSKNELKMTKSSATLGKSYANALGKTPGKTTSIARPAEARPKLSSSKAKAKPIVSKSPPMARPRQASGKPSVSPRKVAGGSEGGKEWGEGKGVKRARPEDVKEERQSPAKSSRSGHWATSKSKGGGKPMRNGKPMRRTRKPREYTDAEVESYVGRDVMVPGKIFKMRDPYYAVITGRDPVKRNSVICQFKEDDSEYWFPLDDVREWLGEI